MLHEVHRSFICVAGVSVTASVLTITALSLHRYMTIHHPIKVRHLSTTSLVLCIIVLIWITAAAVMVPLAVIKTLLFHPLPQIAFTVVMCHEQWPSLNTRRIYDVFLFIVICAIPGGIVIGSYLVTGCRLLLGDQDLQRQALNCHSRNRIQMTRRKVAKMLVVLAISFAISWFPYHIVTLYMDFSSRTHAQSPSTLLALRFCLLLGHSHTAQNPILYCTMNDSFQSGLLALLRCRKLPQYRVNIRILLFFSYL